MCSNDELAASAFLTVNLDDSMDGVATQVSHLLLRTFQVFKGRVQHLGNVLMRRLKLDEMRQ